MAFDDDELREFVDAEFDGREALGSELQTRTMWTPLAPMPDPARFAEDEAFARRHFAKAALAARQAAERAPSREKNREAYNAYQRRYCKAWRARKRAERGSPARLVLTPEERRLRKNAKNLARYHRTKVLKPRAPKTPKALAEPRAPKAPKAPKAPRARKTPEERRLQKNATNRASYHRTSTKPPRLPFMTPEERRAKRAARELARYHEKKRAA